MPYAPCRALAVGASLSLLSLACGGGPGGYPNPDAGDEPLDAAVPDAEPPPPPSSGIDLLFVVNDSQGMGALQQRLGDALPGFLDALVAAEGASPSLHVGVVSTSVAAPGTCFPTGGGELRPQGCLTDGAFASTTAGNFATTIGAAAQCMVELGDLGCPFEQPFEAMRRALDGSVPGNAGFLRDDALLAVVFVVDEDDCSSAEPALYDELAPYGWYGSFRCFEHGVRCDEPVLTTAGPKTNCVPWDEGALFPVGEYAAFLDELKGGPGRVVIGGLSPAAAPVTVIDQSPRFILQSMCQELTDATAVQAWPSVRMHALAARFDAQLGDFCAADFAAQLAPLAQRIADAYVE